MKALALRALSGEPRPNSAFASCVPSPAPPGRRATGHRDQVQCQPSHDFWWSERWCQPGSDRNTPEPVQGSCRLGAPGHAGGISTGWAGGPTFSSHPAGSANSMAHKTLQIPMLGSNGTGCIERVRTSRQGSQLASARLYFSDGNLWPHAVGRHMGAQDQGVAGTCPFAGPEEAAMGSERSSAAERGQCPEGCINSQERPTFL